MPCAVLAFALQPTVNLSTALLALTLGTPWLASVSARDTPASTPSRGAEQGSTAEEKPDAAAPAPEDAAAATKRAGEHLTALKESSGMPVWKNASLKEIRRVEPRKAPDFPTLPAVWHARVEGPEGSPGYLLWETAGEGKLLEFFLDVPPGFDPGTARAVSGIPALQQFPVPREDGSKVASGCVPTAGASVFAYWEGQLGEKPVADLAGLEALTLRIRSRMKMQTIPDPAGFTENGMDLAGAQPRELAVALQQQATAENLPLTPGFHSFSWSKLKAEISAGRPALVSCTVRVPHKPELSWGHEVAAVATAKIGSGEFVGVIDNFFPVRNPGAIRWIRSDAFHSLITLEPALPSR